LATDKAEGQERDLLRRYIFESSIERDMRLERLFHKGAGRPKGIDIATMDKIIDALADAPKSFGTLKEITGVNPIVLKKHLTLMKTDGSVKRTVLPRKGHYVEYSMVGEPYTVIENEIMKLEGRPKVRPYERYRIQTAEDKEWHKRRSRALHKALAVADFKSIWGPGGVLRQFQKEDSYEFPDEIKESVVQAVEFYRKQMDVGKLTAESQVSAGVLPWKLFLDDYTEGRICLDCFRKGTFSTLLAEPESRFGNCPHCGQAVEMARSTEYVKSSGVYENEEERSAEPALDGVGRLGGKPMPHEMAILKRLNEALKGNKQRPASYVVEASYAKSWWGAVAPKVHEVLLEVDPQRLKSYVQENQYREEEYQLETRQLCARLFHGREKLTLEMVREIVAANGSRGVYTRIYEKLKERLKEFMTEDGYVVLNTKERG